MSKRIIDVLFARGAMELDRRNNVLTPWTLDNIKDDAPTGTGQSLFQHAETLVVDNVTKYIYEVCEQETWSGDDYPNCAPPYPTFWMETRAPTYMRSGTTVRPWEAQHAWGALFIASDIPSDLATILDTPASHTRLREMLHTTWQGIERLFAAQHIPLPRTAPRSDAEGRAWFAALPAECQYQIQQYVMVHHALEGLDLNTVNAHGARWHYQIIPFMQLAGHDVVRGPLGFGVALVTQEGRLLAQPTIDGREQCVQWGIKDGEVLAAEHGRQFAGFLNVLLIPMWLALSFLHCKNVTLTHEDPCHSRKPPKPGERCRRLHYHVLNIQPMQEVLRSEGKSSTTGLKHALSICRGHFKNYHERGLFGRYKGMYWWGSHIRGRSDHGVTVKDYAIQGPRTDRE